MPFTPGVRACIAALLLFFGQAAMAERIVVISDINGSYGSTEYNPRVARAVERIRELRPDLVISAGDLVAGQKQPLLDEPRLNAMWASFHALVTEPLGASGIEFVVAPGNHDGSALPGFERERKVFRAQWIDRRPEIHLLTGSDWPRRYAFWLNDILVIVIDGSRAGALDAADHDLLRLAVSAGDRARFTIVVSHLPAWPLAQGRERETIGDSFLSSLIEQGKIQFLLSGHHHVFYPGRDRFGTVHLATGPLGGNARKLAGQDGRAAFSFLVLDICGQGWRVSARKAPAFTQEVDIGRLPRQMGSGQDRLTRVDQSWDMPFAACRPDSKTSMELGYSQIFRERSTGW